ncbi:hypothetical protein FT663_01564 [Candidozyma haemuli var. vulneris]|uniref:WSC domain-containing protein n=1 Tax=Candidozyma haemuli TaxID=45357 RepID=A0A2V1ARE6_9ASCO|nr:hypothetical protein CXQ85_002099 [[Candida] haemuloni]KAF3990719.1 hypothetical protein FT662_02142 [[Candida] haemuloni var. vulneris]KAF3994333.1 hypothetical protein FT663_01564 [[Candida] haemuloni var. vulneris]PVH20312.1 hypothetical protein CXQ85_002099 [[Candida] haemuloni]
MIFVLLLFLASAVHSADTGIGCFSEVETNHFMENGRWETSDLCSQRCGTSYPYVAIKNGGQCYCLTSKPTANQVYFSQCSTPCNGYGSVNCGGPNAYSVFKGLGEDTGSSAGSSSSSSFLFQSSSSSSSSLLAPTTSSIASTTPSSAVAFNPDLSSSSTTSTSHTTSSMSSSSTDAETSSAPTRTVTHSSDPSSTSSSSPSASSPPDNTQRASSTNVGAIAGGVVGGVVGLICIGLAIFFFIRHKRKNDESDEEEFFEKGSGSGALSRGNGTAKSKKYNSAFDMPMANPFSDEFADKRTSKMTTNGLADPRLNPAIVGRRRLSDGSLADETDYSRKILAVANP